MNKLESKTVKVVAGQTDNRSVHVRFEVGVLSKKRAAMFVAAIPDMHKELDRLERRLIELANGRES
jgi:hypothetical protein